MEFRGANGCRCSARGQVANARTSTGRSLKTLQRALNALLPADIAVVEARDVEWSFHARFSAWRRDYRYVILNQPAGRRCYAHTRSILRSRLTSKRCTRRSSSCWASMTLPPLV